MFLHSARRLGSLQRDPMGVKGSCPEGEADGVRGLSLLTSADCNSSTPPYVFKAMSLIKLRGSSKKPLTHSNLHIRSFILLYNWFLLPKTKFRHLSLSLVASFVSLRLAILRIIPSIHHPNPLINTIGNYSLTDLQSQYPKYIHKRPKHILL